MVPNVEIRVAGHTNGDTEMIIHGDGQGRVGSNPGRSGWSHHVRPGPTEQKLVDQPVK